MPDAPSLQDWVIRYTLAKASGVSEVASVGGFVKRYQVIVDPQKLQAYGISLATVSQAILNTIDRGDTTPPPRATCISLLAAMQVRCRGAYSVWLGRNMRRG